MALPSKLICWRTFQVRVPPIPVSAENAVLFCQNNVATFLACTIFLGDNDSRVVNTVLPTCWADQLIATPLVIHCLLARSSGVAACQYQMIHAF